MNHLSTEERNNTLSNNTLSNNKKEWKNHNSLLNKLKVKKTNNTRKVLGKRVASLLTELTEGKKI